ncbi:MAG: ABC transporter ATP-binding protein [Thermoprotei archaeon]
MQSSEISGTSMLELDHVSVEFAIKGVDKPLVAVKDATFSMGDGELVALVGESGSGKTTLGRVVVGLQKPTRGTAKFRGKDIYRLKGKDFLEYRRSVQLVHQDPYAALNPALTIYDSLAPALKRWKLVNKGDVRKEVASLLEFVGLRPENYMDKYPNQLSGGERQRICVARALSVRPKLIVADEPVTMIDVSLRLNIVDLLLRSKAEFGTGYIFITHDMALARYFLVKGGGGRLLVMQNGVVVESGEVEEVINNPKHEYTKKLISSVTE